MLRILARGGTKKAPDIASGAFSIAVRFLLGGGSLSGRSLGCGSFGLGLLGAAATGGLLGFLLAGGKGGLVEVHELYEHHFGGVTAAETGVEDTEVSTGTIGHFGSDGAEELGRCLFVLEVAEDNAAGVGSIFFGLGDEGLNVRLEGLGFGLGGGDPLLQDEGGCHVGQHSLAVTALATKMIDCSIVSHC